MNKKVLISGLLCAIGFTTIFGFSTGFAFDLFGKSTVDEPLRSVSFSSGGDMQGSFHGMSVNTVDDNTVLVCYEDAKWHHEIVAVKEYLVPISILEDIKVIFNNNKLARCEKAPKSKYVVLDGATKSYYFNFDKKFIKFSSTQELSRENYNALREISNCISLACQKVKPLPALVLEKDADGYLPRRNAVEKGKISIKVIGYKGKNLSIAVGNGYEEEKKLDIGFKLSNMNNPNTVIAEHLVEEKAGLPKLYNYEYTWNLNERLEAGRYRLSLGEYATEFELK